MRKITFISMILCLTLLFAGCGTKDSGKIDHKDDKTQKKEAYEDDSNSSVDEAYDENNSDSDNREYDEAGEASEGDNDRVSLKKSKKDKTRDWSKRSTGDSDDLNVAGEYKNDRDNDRNYDDEPMGDARDNGELSGSEIKFFEKELNSIGYYGFLMREYDDPRYIDWDEVFYLGAGFDQGRPSKKIQNAFLKATGDEEIYTDLTVVSKEDVESYVRSTTGYDYSKMRKPLDWTYLEDYDLYIFEHGDTNQIPIRIISGFVKDGEYNIIYKYDDKWGNFGDATYQVTFLDGYGTYRFISNLENDQGAFNPNPDLRDYADEYLLPDSDSRYLTEEDLEALDPDDLRIARNEIYARHGRKFADPDLQAYFDEKNWYYGTIDPKKFDEKTLNKYESYNRDFIVKYEKDHGKKK